MFRPDPCKDYKSQTREGFLRALWSIVEKAEKSLHHRDFLDRSLKACPDCVPFGSPYSAPNACLGNHQPIARDPWAGLPRRRAGPSSASPRSSLDTAPRLAPDCRP